MVFNGAGVAIVTPFNPDYSINYPLFDQLLDFQFDNGIDAIIVCGTTGESATLTYKEHEELIEHTIRFVAGRVPVVAGTGSNETRRALELTKRAEELGADAALIVTPYYNKTSQRGLYEHFKQINDACSLPIIMYNVPSRTGLNMSADTTIALSKLKNIVATKEASSDIVQIAHIARDADPHFSIYSGNDNETVPILSVGGVGVISVSANIIPTEMSKIVRLYLEKKHDESRELFLKYLPLFHDLFIDVNPIPVKHAMELFGFSVGSCRLPLISMEESQIDRLKISMTEAGLL